MRIFTSTGLAVQIVVLASCSFVRPRAEHMSPDPIPILVVTGKDLPNTFGRLTVSREVMILEYDKAAGISCRAEFPGELTISVINCGEGTSGDVEMHAINGRYSGSANFKDGSNAEFSQMDSFRLLSGAIVLE